MVTVKSKIWLGPVVHPLQFGVVQVSVNLRRGDARVTEDPLDETDVPAASKEGGRKSVPQDVRRDAFVDRRGLGRAGDGALHRNRTRRGPVSFARKQIVCLAFLSLGQPVLYS